MHTPFTLDLVVQLHGSSSKSLDLTPLVSLAVRSPMNACPRFGNLWYDMFTRNHLSSCLSRSFLMIACIGGCFSVHSEQELTPMQKNDSLLRLNLFSFFSISFSSLVFCPLRVSSSENVGKMSGAMPAILSAAACLG